MCTRVDVVHGFSKAFFTLKNITVHELFPPEHVAPPCVDLYDTNYQQHYVQMSYTEFHQNRTKMWKMRTNINLLPKKLK